MLSNRYTPDSRLNLDSPEIKEVLRRIDAPPPQTVQPQAAAKIAAFLANRYSLRTIPLRLAELAEEGHHQLCPANMSRISVGVATCGQAAGAGFRSILLSARPDFVNDTMVRNVGCLGACFAEPLLDVRTPDGLHYFFGQVNSKNSIVHWSIIHTAQKRSWHRGIWLIMRERQPGMLTGFGDLELEKDYTGYLGTFLEHQKRRISGNCGLIDPHSLPEYVATGGYFAFAKALLQLSPAQVLAEVTASGLRGRGGGGFSTGEKWEIGAASRDAERIIIANADEGDPGAYMDRALVESDPHRVLEGIMLAAYAVGARQAHIFVRHEYPLARASLRRAINDARDAGLLGNNILGTGFLLDIGITQSAGAFVCGEETAMIQVLRGNRGEPLPRPPYPAQKGLNDHPTVINNVETLANVPWIIAHGAGVFREVGTAGSPGTKIFCLAGDVPSAGFIEVPLGTSATTVVEKIGRASPQSVKALQIGGPSGGIVPYSDFFLDYTSVSSIGAMIGSGGLVVLNKNRCLVDLVHHLVGFMADESCGQCLLCRDGLATLKHMLAILTGKEAKPELLIAKLEELSWAIATLSRCGLGRSAVNPLLTTLKYFREEYNAHLDAICPAASCKAMIHFEIIPAHCTDCENCSLLCPVEAITLGPGKGPERYIFNHDRCIRCWTCAAICPHGCIQAVSGGINACEIAHSDNC